MKSKTYIINAMIILLAITLFVPGNHLVKAQADTETPTPTSTSTSTPVPSETATPFSRPIIMVDNYTVGSETISPGKNFPLNVVFHNNGAGSAYNVIVTFSGELFTPLETGGVISVGDMGPGSTQEIHQAMLASTEIWSSTQGVVTMVVNYTDSAGAGYSESFNLTIPVKVDYSAWVPSETPTNTVQPRAQLVVESYSIDKDILQPGMIFNLNVDVRNLGSTDAKNVTMILGGTSATAGGGMETPSPGMSGNDAELSTFSPLGSSNLIYMENIPVSGLGSAETQLIVNVSANPGAYPFKLSFVYFDENGNKVIDNQVITLLIYSLPQVEVSFYRDPGMIFAGDMGQLPLQITNLGKSKTVLGNMQVSSDQGSLMDNVAFVGSLEAGGYFSMDATFFPEMPGPATLTITVSYTDDFNQPRIIEQNLTINVEEMPVMEISPEEMEQQMAMNPMPDPQQESIFQLIWRFIKGLLGLGSEKPSQSADFQMPPSGEYIEMYP